MTSKASGWQHGLKAILFETLYAVLLFIVNFKLY